MSIDPFWKPKQYSKPILLRTELVLLNLFLVPVLGMLCGSAISGVIMSISYILKELQ